MSESLQDVKFVLEQAARSKNAQQSSSQTKNTPINQQHRTLDEQLKNPTQEELSTLLKVPKSQIRNISDYQILERLGKGTSSRVYRALSPEQEIVAIKEYNFALTLNQFDEEKEAFQREAALFRDLGNHSQIPSFIAIAARISEHTGDFIEYNPSIVMEHVTGKTLAERIALREGFAPQEIRDHLQQIISPLRELHHGNSQPRFHRDIKPANLKMNEEGLLYILDFGSVRDTLIGTFGATMGKGSFGYVHKEQFAGNPSFRTDLYSLGRTLYAAAIGKELIFDEKFSKEQLDQTNLDSNTKDVIEILCRENLSGPQNVDELSDLINPKPIEVRGEESSIEKEVEQSTELEVVGEKGIDKKTINNKKTLIALTKFTKPVNFPIGRSINYVASLASTFAALRIYYYTQDPILAGATLLAPLGLSWLSSYSIRKDQEVIDQKNYEIRQLENEIDELSQGTLVQGNNLEHYESELNKLENKLDLNPPGFGISLALSIPATVMAWLGNLPYSLIGLGAIPVLASTATYCINNVIKNEYNKTKYKEAIAIINEQDPKVKEARRRAFDLKFDEPAKEYEEKGEDSFGRRWIRKKRKKAREGLLEVINEIDQKRKVIDGKKHAIGVWQKCTEGVEQELPQRQTELSQKLQELQQGIQEVSERSLQKSDGLESFYQVQRRREQTSDVETAISLINFVYDRYSRVKEYASQELQKLTRRDAYSVAIRRIIKNVNEFRSTGVPTGDLEIAIKDTDTERVKLGIQKTRCDYNKLRKVNARNRNRYLSDQVRKMSLKGDRKPDFECHVNELNQLYEIFPDIEKLDINHFDWLWRFNNIRLAQYNSIDDKVKAYLVAVDMFDKPEHVKLLFKQAIQLASEGKMYGSDGVEERYHRIKDSFNESIPNGVEQLITDIYKDAIPTEIPKMLKEILGDDKYGTKIPVGPFEIYFNYINDLEENIESFSNETIKQQHDYWNRTYQQFMRISQHSSKIKLLHKIKEVYRFRLLQIQTDEENQANKAQL